MARLCGRCRCPERRWTGAWPSTARVACSSPCAMAGSFVWVVDNTSSKPSYVARATTALGLKFSACSPSSCHDVPDGQARDLGCSNPDGPPETPKKLRFLGRFPPRKLLYQHPTRARLADKCRAHDLARDWAF